MGSLAVSRLAVEEDVSSASIADQVATIARKNLAPMAASIDVTSIRGWQLTLRAASTRSARGAKSGKSFSGFPGLTSHPKSLDIPPSENDALLDWSFRRHMPSSAGKLVDGTIPRGSWFT